jgi:hypothetical protein
MSRQLVLIVTGFSIAFLLLLRLSPSTASFNASYLLHSAFCRPKDRYHGQYFPVDVPEAHLPWIWEAVYDPVAEHVDISTLNRNPCHFDKTAWQDLVSVYPQYANQLGFGLETNILVPFDVNTTKSEMFYLLGDVVFCEFHDVHGNLVYRVRSKTIYGKKSFVSLGTLQIRCPISKSMVWETVRLQLNPKRSEYLKDIFSDTTVAVPACRLPDYNPYAKQYRLSVCSATKRANRSQLVEWIEYHQLQGVEHFFLYDTAISEEHGSLAQALSDYVKEGIVSIIPWPYMNCVRDMAGGRWSSYRKKREYLIFKSPRAISQHAALASCYSRFRHTSIYMTHIDDDEFLVYSPELIASNYMLTRAPRNLFELAESIFKRNPREVALRFEPVVFTPCNQSNHKQIEYYNAIASADTSTRIHYEQQYRATPLPRLGTWDASYRYRAFECKILWRTDAVAMFFVHFISMVDDARFKDVSMTLPLTHIAMLHYKYPASLTRNILEGHLPFKDDSFAQECNEIPPRFKIYHAQVPYSLAEELKQRYLHRMQHELRPL